MTLTNEYDYDAFISYNRADEEWATKLATMLEGEHWQDRTLEVFYAPWDIKPGVNLGEAASESRKW